MIAYCIRCAKLLQDQLCVACTKLSEITPIQTQSQAELDEACYAGGFSYFPMAPVIKPKGNGLIDGVDRTD